jgi:hypothetical protein
MKNEEAGRLADAGLTSSDDHFIRIQTLCGSEKQPARKDPNRFMNRSSVFVFERVWNLKQVSGRTKTLSLSRADLIMNSNPYK